jgi:hypothetical protein
MQLRNQQLKTVSLLFFTTCAHLPGFEKHKWFYQKVLSTAFRSKAKGIAPFPFVR